jgi:hypothetical protein
MSDSKIKKKIKASDLEEYSYHKKKDLAARISKIRNQTLLHKIEEIIYTYNKNVRTSVDSSGGETTYFQNFTNITYYKLQSLLNKVERKKQKKIEESINNTDFNQASSDITDTDYATVRSRLRFSNKEVRLLKKKEYEKDMKKSNVESDIETKKKNKRKT